MQGGAGELSQILERMCLAAERQLESGMEVLQTPAARQSLLED